MKPFLLDSYFLIYLIKLIRKNRNIFLESVSVKTRITLHLLTFTVVITCRTRHRWAHSERGEG
jgi:hypothetical protein